MAVTEVDAPGAIASAAELVRFASTKNGEHNSSEVQIRRQAYCVVTRGVCGQIFRANPMWLLGEGGVDAVDQSGGRQTQHVAPLIGDVPWWNLEPDRDHEIVVGGRGEFRGLNLCSVAHTPERDLAVAYLPMPRPITFGLGALAAWRVRVVWHHPTQGRPNVRRFVRGHGRVELVPTGSHDWEFILTTESEAA